MADDIVVVLELAEFGNGEFWVKFNSPAIGQTKARLDGEALVALRARLESVELSVLSSSAQVLRRRAGSHTLERSVREFGESLYGAVLRNGVRDAFQQARGIAKHRKQPLRVELRIDSPTLAALPWEFLYDRSNDDYLALAASVTRYQEQLEPVTPLLVPPPLRVLGVVASPDGSAALDVGKERANLEKAIGPLGSDRVNLTWMEGQSADDLRNTLYERSWHVLHFVGHGGFDEEEDEGFLELTDAEGRPDRLFASRLGRYLEDSQSLRLVVLNACESGRTGLDTLSGTAATIMRAGVPAVVAMQYEISDPGAITFAKSFYQGLATGRTLDRAVTAARGAMKDANRDTLEWGTPVLYLRSEGARIFDVTPTAPPIAPPHQDKVPPPSPPQPNREPAPPDRTKIPPSPPILSTLSSSPLFKRHRWSPDLASKVRDLLTPGPQARPKETVRAVEAQGAAEVCRLTHPGAVHAVLFDPARAALVSGSSDGTILLWDSAKTEVIRTLRVAGISAPVRSLALVPGREFLAAAYGDGTVRVWHVDTEAVALTVRPAGTTAVHSVSCSGDGRTLAIGCNAGLTVLIDHRGREVARLRHRAADGAPDVAVSDVLATAFSPDARWLLTGGSDGSGQLWGAQRSVTTIFPHPMAVTSAAFAPDGRCVVTGCADGTARVWDDAATIIDRQRHDSSIVAVGTAGNQRAVSAFADGMVVVWRHGGSRIATVRLPAALHDVSITADGRWLATAGADCMARVWKILATQESP